MAELEAVRRVPGWLPEPPEREPARRAVRSARRRGPRPDLPPPDQWRYADPPAPEPSPPLTRSTLPVSRAARRAAASAEPPPLIRIPVAFRQARVGPGRWAVLGVVVVALVAMSLFATRALLARAHSQPQTFSAPVATSGRSAQPMVTGETSSRATSSGGGLATSSVAARIEVHVLGQVHRPGVVTVSAGARVQDVVRAAGGLLASADLTRVNLARHVQDGEQIVVPRPGQEVTTAPGPAASTATGASASASPVDLNAADATALDTLPGVGPVLAARIVAYREANGPFRSVDQLDEVSGIGAKLMEQLRPLVHV